MAITVIYRDSNLTPDQLDGACADLIELGACGTSVEDTREITCYIEGDDKAREDFIKRALNYGFTLLGQSEVQLDSWAKACSDVWEPITVEGIQVVPVESLEDQRQSAKDAIRIIPGLGFGTGHHCTTKMVLGALARYARELPLGFRPNVFDLGTGSGILAIAAAKLLKTQVIGNDIDPGALNNANDNIRLNQVEKLVTVTLNPLEKQQGVYDLFLANLYGEVLERLCCDITRLAAPGARVILSGITEIVWGSVCRIYTEEFNWRLISEEGDSGWVCAVMTR